MTQSIKTPGMNNTMAGQGLSDKMVAWTMSGEYRSAFTRLAAGFLSTLTDLGSWWQHAQKSKTTDESLSATGCSCPVATVSIQSARPKSTHSIPPGSWDSHMHVVDPETYLLAPGAVYRPKPHKLDEAVAFQASVGFYGMVLVQPSIYVYDNTCLLEALRQLGPERGRGVVSFSSEAIPNPEILREWHEIGVRGVRVNFSSVGKVASGGELEQLLLRYAEPCRRIGWVIQLYMPMSMLELLEPIVPKLGGVRICLDHIGNPSLDLATSNQDIQPYETQGFASLIRLLEAGNTFIKLSAPYRLLKDSAPGDEDRRLKPMVKEILRVAGRTRVIFATDWPHTRFEGLDIRPWIQTVVDLCGGDDQLLRCVFRLTAEELWDVTTKTT
jgi:predicted TIM-barrel fold metal-dependent hydrolase